MAQMSCRTTACLLVLLALPSLADDAPAGDKPPARYPVYVDKKWGYIDERGQIVIEIKFNHALDFSEGLAQVRLDGKYGYIDTQGRWLFDAGTTIDPRPFRSGVAVIDTEQGKAIINRTGQRTEARFALIEDFSEGLAAVGVRPQHPKLDVEQLLKQETSLEQWGFADTSGALVIPAKYAAVGSFANGLAPVYVGGRCDRCQGPLGGKWGYINRQGQLVIEAQFDQARPFSEGLAQVSNNRQRGWIDTTGKFAIPLRSLSIAGDFHQGFARIRGTPEGDSGIPGKDPGWRDFGYITKQGKVFVHSAFDAMAAPFVEGLAEARAKPVWDAEQETWIQGLYGYVDLRGEWIIKPQFTHTNPFRNGLARVQRDGKMLYIDKQGQVIWPK